MADNSIGISLVITAIDKGSAILAQLSAGLEKIGISAGSAGSKSAQAGQQMETAFKGVSDHLERSAKAVKKVEDSIRDMGLALTGFGAAIMAPFGLGVKAAADFEKEMLKVKAVTNFSPDTGVAEKQFQQLTETARKFGTETTYSATQVAQGLTELGRAGYDTEKMVGAIGPALNLAFVESRAMGETVEDVVGILSSFQYGVDQANRVTDVLAYTSNATTTSMAGLAESLKFCATLASQLGMSVEETSGILGVFANNNIKGTMAGTALRRIMAELSNPLEDARATLASMNVEIVKNADGSLNLVKTFEALSKAGMTTSQAFKLFGDLGANAALVATKNVDAIKKLVSENQNAAGSLQKMVDTMNSGFLPAWEKFKNTLSEVGIQFGTAFLSGLKVGLDALRGLLKWVVDLGKQFPVLSNVLVGGAGAFGVVALALGGLSLAASILKTGWDRVTAGFELVFGAGTRVLGLTRQKIPAIQAETIAIQQQTVALNALAAANQRRINTMSNPKNFGPGSSEQYVPVLTGRTGGPSTTPPTGQPGLKFSGAGVGGAALAGGALAAVSGSETMDIVKWAGISAAMQLVASNAGVVYGKLAALIPTWGMVTAAVSSFISALSAAGTAIAAFAATPIGLVAGAIAAVVGTVAGGYKILNDRREAAAIQADTLKRSQDDLKRAIAEGFDPNKAITKVNTAALTTDPYTDLIDKRKQAVADFAGINEKLTQAREKDAQSLLGGKSKETEETEKQAALARENLNLVQTEINRRIDQRQAVEAVGKEHEKNAESQKKEVKTSEQLLQLAKDRAEIEVKLIADSIKTKEELNKLDLEQTKVRINASVQSETQAKQLIDGLAIASSKRTIALAETEYAQTRVARDKAYAEQKAIYEKMVADNEKLAESKKGLEELEKQRTENQIADSQKLTQAIVQEVQNQIKAKDEQVKKIRDFEKQLRDEQQATTDALHQVSDANVNEYTKIQLKVGDVATKLAEATRLIPSMPERALELFKQVRSESSGLVQNIEQFNQRLRDASMSGQDALRKINAYGLTGADKYKSEIDDIQLMIKRANTAIAGGRFSEAENLFKSAMSAAQGLPGSAEKTGNEEQDKKNLEQAKQDATLLVRIATGGMNDAINMQKTQAEAVNKQAKDNIQKAQDAIKGLIEAQIESSKGLIRALDENTAALQGKVAESVQGQGGTAGAGEQTGALQKAATEVVGKSGAASPSSIIGQDAAPAGIPFDSSAGQPSGSPAGVYYDKKTKQFVIPETSTLTRAEKESYGTTNALFAEIDRLKAQSDRESDTMAARMDALKYAESMAGNLDRQEKMGYFQTTPGQASKGDTGLMWGMNKLFGGGMDATKGIFDNLPAILDRMSAGAMDKYGPMIPLAQGAGTGASQNAYTQMSEMLDRGLNPDIFTRVGDTIAETASKKLNEVLGKGFKVNISVKDEGRSDTTITRLGDQS